ncbi:MAG: M23 family metallopeptidase [Thermoleophilia bacterium]|nr:M23 family metallopeptidase [Thermoleophilia bacterium]
MGNPDPLGPGPGGEGESNQSDRNRVTVLPGRDQGFAVNSHLARLVAGATIAVFAILVPAMPAEAAKPTPARGYFAGLVEIKGGRQLYMECRGRGTPTVILEAGSGNAADVWTSASLKADDPTSDPRRAVLPTVARFTRVCAYDRAGAEKLQNGEPNRSDPVALPTHDERSQHAKDGGDALTPVLQRVLSRPRWYRGDDGRVHLKYELLLTNNTQISVNVASLDVLSGVGHRISRLSGARLQTAMGWGTGPTTELGPFSVGIVWIDLSFVDRQALPRRVKHRLTVDVPPGLPIGPVITDTSANVSIERRAAERIAAPLQGPRWATVVGPHRRAIQPVNGSLRLSQRFAIDFAARLDAKKRTHIGSASQNASYLNYGEPVVAVGPGKTVVAVDRYADQIPNDPDPVDLAEADGNHVILKLDKGVFAAYAHLKPGSVRVRPGQRVAEGQVLGKLGNSGSSTGPYLHFQLMNRPSLLDADGLPFVFDRFYLYGRMPSLESLIDNDREGTPVPLDRSVAGKHRRQSLTDLDVVNFPGR